MLNATPNRLALLREVAAGNVVYVPAVGRLGARSAIRKAALPGRVVSKAMAEFGYYGWAEKGKPEGPGRPYAARPWHITDIGQAILDAVDAAAQTRA